MIHYISLNQHFIICVIFLCSIDRLSSDLKCVLLHFGYDRLNLDANVIPVGISISIPRHGW